MMRPKDTITQTRGSYCPRYGSTLYYSQLLLLPYASTDQLLICHRREYSFNLINYCWPFITWRKKATINNQSDEQLHQSLRGRPCYCLLLVDVIACTQPSINTASVPIRYALPKNPRLLQKIPLLPKTQDKPEL